MFKKFLVALIVPFVLIIPTANAQPATHIDVPTCEITGDAIGYCNNTGRVFHGFVYGCYSDEVYTRYVRIFDIQTGNTTFSFKSPIQAHTVIRSISGQREEHSWSNEKTESAGEVEAYIRVYDWDSGAYIPEAGMDCVCSCSSAHDSAHSNQLGKINS